MPLLRALTLVALLAALAPAQDGVVRSSGQPLPGATITAKQGDKTLTTVTDETGLYHFKDLPPGDWDLAVDFFGFATATKSIKAPASTPTEWSLSLQTQQAATATPAPRTRPAPPATATTSTRPNGGFSNRPGNSTGTAQGRPGGFQNLTLNQNGPTSALDEIPAEATPAATSGDSNEAFLVNGSLAQGLAQARPDDPGPGGFGRGFDPNNPNAGAGGAGPDGGFPGGQVPGGPGGPGGGGRGGGGGFGGGPGGGGFGGGGGRGGGGGPGGGQRRQRPGGQAFGNRAGRGRDGIHGSAFFTIGNSLVNAQPYSINGEDISQPSYGSARFGLSAGGALIFPKLIKDPKTFFFLNYTGTRSRAPYEGTNTVPTLAERMGNFSEATTTVGTNPTPVQIYDPANNHQPFPGNVIPASRFDPAAVKLLSYIPLPNLPGTLNNYQIRRSVPNNTENLNLRVNRPLTQKDQFDANFNLQLRDARNAQLFGYTDATTGSGFSISVGVTHTFTRTMLDAVHFTMSRNNSTSLPFFAYGANVAALVGINGTSADPRNYGPPNLSFTNFAGLTDASTAVNRAQTAAINDTFTLVKGRETFRFGGDYSRRDSSPVTDSNGRGSYSFSGLLTSAFTGGLPVPNTGYDFADYLLGLPQSSSIRFGDSANYFRANAYDAFVTDDIRAKSGLTLNIGLRYEYFSPYSEKYNHLANLDIAPGFTNVAVVLPGQTGPYSGTFSPGLVNSDKLNFSPRVAVAYKPKKNTVIRSGYSIFYNGSIYTQFAARLASQPPFAKSSNLVTDTTDPLTVENGFNTVTPATITNTYAVDKNYRMPYIQTWNFSIQQTLPASFQVELTYTGTKGTRLDIQEQPNRSLAGSFTDTQQTQSIKNATQFLYETSQGNSIYHALTARINRRFARGVSFTALYTFSKSIDDASSIGGGGATVAQNFYDLSAERGLSSFNRTHVLSTNFIFTSPVGENGKFRLGGWRETLLKDWQLSGGVTFQTGLPFTAQVLGNQSNIAGSGSVGSGRAQATGEPLYGSGVFFNPNAFTYPVPGTYGDAGRNTIIGPSALTANVSFARSFRLKDDRHRIEFRLDGNNLTNSVNISSFNTIFGATNYGLPLAASGMRVITATVRLRF